MPRLIHQRRWRRKRRPRRMRATLTIPTILAWADAHHARTGAWPMVLSGSIPETFDENWSKVDQALRNGHRDLPGGTSLAQLLAQERGTRNPKRLPPLTVPQICLWAQAHHRLTGTWPVQRSGPILEAPGETWQGVDADLRYGNRGLIAGSSLAKMLAAELSVRNLHTIKRLQIELILAWVDAYKYRNGKWPKVSSGPIPESPGDTWQTVDNGLRAGHRGLPGNSSLAEVLLRHRGVRNHLWKPRLNVVDVQRWIYAYRQRVGEWPSRCAEPIVEAPDETWWQIDRALRNGCRGLPGGSSLALLVKDMMNK